MGVHASVQGYSCPLDRVRTVAGRRTAKLLCVRCSLIAGPPGSFWPSCTFPCLYMVRYYPVKHANASLRRCCATYVAWIFLSTEHQHAQATFVHYLNISVHINLNNNAQMTMWLSRVNAGRLSSTQASGNDLCVSNPKLPTARSQLPFPGQPADEYTVTHQPLQVFPAPDLLCCLAVTAP